MVQIPQTVLDAYVAAASDMINSNFGVHCKLIYPPTKTLCVNCVFDPIGRKSANRYADGGPAPFNFGTCPLCGGQGYMETEVSDTIMLRVYYNPRYFIKVAELVNIPQTSAQVIGFMSDLHKFRNANRIITQFNQSNPELRTYERMGEYVPYGLGPEKIFFICFLKRAA